MSSRAVKKFKRVYKIASTSWTNNVLTVTTTVAHYLVNGDSVTLLFNSVPQFLTGVVSNAGSAGSSVTFDIPCPMDYKIVGGGEVVIEYFTPGLAATTVNSGILPTFLTTTNANYGNKIVQGVLSASGNATFKIQGSLDGINYIDITGATVTISAGTSAYTTISDKWIYIRPVMTLTATQNLTILVSI